MNFNFYLPTKILFGKGRLNDLYKEQLPGRKAMIVISAGKSMRVNGYLARVEEQLDKAGVTHVLFDKILPNPVLRHVMEGAAFAKENGCDFVLGLGGGSSIDAAKAIAVMATNPGDYWDYTYGSTGKRLPVPNDPLPIVAIPTTAGTGTESGPWTVITKEETNEKCGFGYEKTYPVLSIVDYELMMTVPPMLTAYQGFDAFFHASESIINKYENPIGEICALKAIEYIAKYLPTAVNNGADEEAREYVALASTLAGFNMICISEHSLEHALSAYHHELPHGAGLIMISLAYYQHFVDCHACDELFIKMAQVMGVSNAISAQDFVNALAKLQKDCHVDNLKMSDYNIDSFDFINYAKTARNVGGRLYEEDPAPLSDEDAIKIYKKSYR
jgi:alcohol dehydrogenase